MEGIRYVLLDIEGTICPISFVRETLFPYAIKALPDVLSSKWDDQDFQQYRDAFPEEHRSSPDVLQAHVEDLTKRDVKIAYLKNLQGYLWKEGYESGAYSTPLFPDVAPQLKRWRGDGVQLAIYSSGSVFAQKLLFQHVNIDTSAAAKKRTATEALEGEVDGDAIEPTTKSRRVTRSQAAKPAETEAKPADGEVAEAVPLEPIKPSEDLTELIDGWFDTVNAGMKSEPSSYDKIAAALTWQPSNTLFLSDNVKEIDAATKAGMNAILVDRLGNAPISAMDQDRMDIAQSLQDISLTAIGGEADVFDEKHIDGNKAEQHQFGTAS